MKIFKKNKKIKAITNANEGHHLLFKSPIVGFHATVPDIPVEYQLFVSKGIDELVTEAVNRGNADKFNKPFIRKLIDAELEVALKQFNLEALHGEYTNYSLDSYRKSEIKDFSNHSRALKDYDEAIKEGISK